MADINQKCKLTGESFSINDWEQKFLKKLGFPFPTLCIEERTRRRLAYRNERRLYKTKCAFTGESIISIFSPDKPYKVYSQGIWWGDKWDAKEYGRNFDFNRPFFEQFYELQLAVPKLSLGNIRAENSEYCNITTDNKNCYLVFGGDFNEDCMYSVFNMYCKNCGDVYFAASCELCYEVIDCDKCYSCKYLQNCGNCRDSYFLFECRGCANCFGCVGLRDKQYYVLNKPYSKNEYEKKIKEMRLDNHESLQKLENEFKKFRLKFPHRYANIINCENASGDNIINSKNCINCFDVVGPAEDLKDNYLAGWGIKDSLSSDHVGHKSELFYECISSINGYNCAFARTSWDSNNVYYSDMIVGNSHDIFGCCGMKKAQYCIFNKQYKKEEYEKLREKIVEHMKKTGEWGEFFPIEYSPFCYNETVAQDLFPLTKEETEKRGLKWMEEEKREIGTGPSIPNSINETDENILKETLICEKTGRPYKINETEFRFYKKLKIPIPHYAPDTRNEVRLGKRNPRKTWQRNCAKCGMEIQTSYAPDRPEIVYCEKCYLDSIK